MHSLPRTQAAIRGAFLLPLFTLGVQAELPFRINGIMRSEGVTQVSLGSRDGGSSWVKVGSRYRDWTVTGVDVPRSEVSFRNDQGDTETLHLAEATIKDLRARWIRSTENPLFFKPARVPSAVLQDWENLSELERKRIADEYLKYGWILKVSSRSPGSHLVEMEAIHEPERRAEVKKMFAEFNATLSDEGRRAMAASTAVFPTNSPPKNFAWVDPKSVMTPEQQANYDKLMGKLQHEPNSIIK